MTGQVIWLQLSVMTKVYAIGGCGHDNNDKQPTTQFGDTIESTKVSSLLLETTETLMTTTTTRQNNSCQWTRLQCHLSSPQKAFALQLLYTNMLHCHFGWSHTGRGQRLVISGYYGHYTTTPQQQQPFALQLLYTNMLHCHFGWSHTGRGQRLVISGYYGHYTTTPQQQQQQQQWRTNNSSMDPA